MLLVVPYSVVASAFIPPGESIVDFLRGCLTNGPPIGVFTLSGFLSLIRHCSNRYNNNNNNNNNKADILSGCACTDDSYLQYSRICRPRLLHLVPFQILCQLDSHSGTVPASKLIASW